MKVGDTVFVVHRNRTEHATVTKVGRKFGFINSYKFNLETGRCTDGVAFINGRGFQVYASEDDYKAEVDARVAHKRLQDRLVSRMGALKTLPAYVVNGIHELLDTMTP
jgi:hypothetical protein